MSQRTGWTVKQYDEFRRRKMQPQPVADIKPATKPTVAERELHRDISNWLLLERIWFVDSRMDKSTRQRKGIPDFICCIGGKFLAVELKRTGERLTDDQQNEFDQIAAARGVAVVVHRLEELIRVISEFKRVD